MRTCLALIATALFASGCCCDLLLFTPFDEVANPPGGRAAALLRPDLSGHDEHFPRRVHPAKAVR